MSKKKMPYVYLIKHKPSGKLYYGVRFGRHAHPDELLVTYFTSSKTVQKLIARDGIDSFEKEIRRTFPAEHCEKAMKWESTVLQRINAAGHPSFLNKTNNNSFVNTKGDRNWMYGLPSHLTPAYGKPRPDHVRAKISAGNLGKPKSDIAKQNMSKAKQKMTDETKQKMSVAHKNRSPEHTEKLTQMIRNRKWLHLNGANKFIKANEIDIWLSNGWILGRSKFKTQVE